MSKFPKFPLSPLNANIPIYLDTTETKESPEPHDIPEYTCPTCETSSRDQPIHCISVASSSPPSYSSISPPIPSSRHLAVPNLSIETPQSWYRPLPSPPRPAFQFDPEGRPHVRFRRNAFSPLSPAIQNDDIDWTRKSHIGLGIPGAQFNPDPSPVTPGTAEKGGEQRTHEPGDTQAASNFAQRIEQKLWKYSASSNVVKRWLLEIISWSLSAICMAGIVGVLIFYKNKRIPNWPLGLTLNAYISVLSKVASAALLLPVSEALGQLKWSWFQGGKSQKMWDFEIFDNASRGPWGSLLLLVRTKGKSLAALGAAVTLFALALDPFFQQVVEYTEHWRIQNTHGSLPRATGYMPFQFGQEFQLDTGLESLELDPSMNGVTHRFFYDNGTSPVTFGKGIRAEIPLSCPNSNCTWPEYETLGVCNECAEVTDLLEFKCMNATLDWIQNPHQDPETDYFIFPNGTSCGWWLKADNPLLMVGYNIDRDTETAGEVLLERAVPLYDLLTREILPGYPTRLNNSRNPLAHVIVASGETLDNVKRNATPIAHECVLSWCVKTLLSTYSEGGYTEQVTNSIINDTVGSSPWITSEYFNEEGVSDGTYYEYVEDIYVKGDSGTTYTIGNQTHCLTLSLFDDIFPSSYTVANSTRDIDAMLRYKQYLFRVPVNRNMTYNAYLHNNISTHLDNLAFAMTNMVRSAPKNTEMIDGPAFDMETFVDVRWAWLALPLGLLGLTFIFLVATVIRSSIEQEHVGVWKTSAIATLLYGLPDEMQKKITSSKETGTPRAKAKEIRVKWLPKGGWRLSGNTFSPTSRKSPQPSTPSPGWI
ncbi:hypothetical protein K458DRAFT_413232 [Lentithecium fluviatile CBS 122367]|uniref:DUF3176 domain containing protein n=1 Tax=Lentithecium fluviatile CBS 122367 TaxID=1168545 RepID=A0A6G1JJY1_9PLEO|nr:hypothetical protein K458DRAFT_413232 [Lentithecium fluviatile CBS 122367]